MNTKGNQRYQNVQESIETAFQQLLEEKTLGEITVSELCRRAGVHRTTFYGHYQDVYALLESILSKMYVSVMEAIQSAEGGGNWLENGLLTLFRFIREHRIFFRAYLGAGDSAGTSFPLPARIGSHVRKLMEGTHTDHKAEAMYHYTFFMEGLKGVLRFWLSRDCAETPEEVLQIIVQEYDKGGLLFRHG